MKRPMILILGLVVVVGLIYAAAQAGSSDEAVEGIVTTADAALATDEPDLDEVRAATERFRDVNVALAEGYVPDPGNLCDTAEMMGQPAALGAMGIHYFRPDLLGITATEPRVDGTSTHVDFTQPSVLIYEPQADGSLTLVAVENLVFIKAWEAAGHTTPPSFQGVVFDHMEDDPATPLDEAHMFEAHYDRHVWVHRENPNGVFAQYNPNVTCPATADTHAH
jgi:hypothetical protein